MKVVGIGEILWDMLPGGKVLGGAPANFAFHVSQFGLDALAVSAIGKDALGEEIKHELTSRRLKVLMTELDLPTGTVKVDLDEMGVPTYEICENVAWDFIPFNQDLKSIAVDTRAVCFGSLAQRNSVSRNTILSFIKTLSASALKIFDINIRQHFYSREILIESLSVCNVLKINDEELELVGRLFEYSDLDELGICHKLFNDFDLEYLVLTKGVKGSVVISKTAEIYKPTPLVIVSDTVGAGDSFTSAFVSAILKGKELEYAHQLAVDVSAFVCTQSGAMPILSDELLMRLKS